MSNRTLTLELRSQKRMPLSHELEKHSCPSNDIIAVSDETPVRAVDDLAIGQLRSDEPLVTRHSCQQVALLGGRCTGRDSIMVTNKLNIASCNLPTLLARHADEHSAALLTLRTLQRRTRASVKRQRNRIHLTRRQYRRSQSPNEEHDHGISVINILQSSMAHMS